MVMRRSPRVRSPREADDSAPNSQEDLNLIDAFCEEITFEEISFEKWSKSHESLDLEVTLFIPTQDQQNEIAVTAQWTRTVYSNDPNERPERIKMQKVLSLVGPFAKKQEILLEGLGDQRGLLCGDLRVIICFR